MHNRQKEEREREREREQASQCEEGCRARAMAGGPVARLSSSGRAQESRALFWLCGGCDWAVGFYILHVWGCELHYVVACITGLEVTWWGPVGTRTVGKQRACVFMCVACVIGLAVTWCGTVGVLVWAGLDWAGQKLGRGEQCVHVCVRVCMCVRECGGMYNRISYYLVRCSWCWALASCSSRLMALACHWLPSFWTASSCCLQPTSSKLSLSTSCPAEMERKWQKEVSKSSKWTLPMLSDKPSNGDSKMKQRSSDRGKWVGWFKHFDTELNARWKSFFEVEHFQKWCVQTKKWWSN